MKVIKPLEVTSIGDIYTLPNSASYTEVNTLDIVPEWSILTTYPESSTFDKVWVRYSGSIYESIKPNNTSNTPNTVGSTFWRYVTDLSTDDFAIENWMASTTYSTGDIVIYTTGKNFPRFYQSLQSSNSNKIPVDNLSGTNPYWLDLGYSNAGKLYDIESNTQTVTTDELITTFTARKSDSAGIFNTTGTSVLITAKSEKNIYDSSSWVTSTEISSTTPTINDIYFSSKTNILLACGNSSFLKYSKDNGTTWNNCTVPNTTSTLKSISYSKESGVFVVVGNTNISTALIWKSLDGINWTNITGLPTSSSTLNKVIWIKSLDKFAAAGSTGYVYTASSSATSWTAASVGVTGNLVDIVYNTNNGSGYGHVHVIGNAILRYSSDLSSWSTLSMTGYNLRAIDVFTSKSPVFNIHTSQYVMLSTATGGNYLHYSTNGFSWTAVQITSGGTPTDLAYCYTERKWILNCSGTILAWDTINGFSTVTPLNFDSTRTKIYYSNSTDTVFLFGNNKTNITSSIIYFKEYKLNTTLVDNWYDYFYKDYDLLNQTIFENIPIYTRTRITVCIIGDIVRCGIVFAGSSANLGKTQYGASAGIIDYSKKETDEFGTTTFIKRAFSKRMNVNIILPSSDLYRVQKVLSDVRATPCIWIGTTDEVYKPLTMYGYYRDFNLEIPYPEYSYCSLQVEGLTE